jgi:HYR domain
VSGDLPASCDHASGAVFGLGVTTVTCRATDAAGNVGSAAFTVVVQDTTAPDVTVPDGGTTEATGPGGAAVTWSGVSAHDAVDGDLPAGCDRASGGTFPLGLTTVTCTATDAHGNTGYGAFVVAVVDTTAPALTVPADRTVEAAGPDGAAVAYAASAADLVDGAVPVTCSPASGAGFGLGDTVVTCTAADAHGNVAARSFTVTVVDTTAPVVTVPGDRTVEATGPDGAAVAYTASAADTVDGTVPVSCSPASGGLFPLGATTVTCRATDAHGNAAARSFTVTVVDTTAPALVLPGNLTAFATSASGAAVTYGALGTDAVAGSIVPVCTPASGSTFAPGTTRVTCTATDAAGNTATGSFTVTVRFDFRGFLNPVDSNVLNVMKGGSTAPIKWQISNQGGGYIGDLQVVSRTASGVVTCGGSTMDDLTQFATGNTALRYDTTSNQYIYNWQSPKTAGKCYQVTIGLTDGRSYSAQFQLR